MLCRVKEELSGIVNKFDDPEITAEFCYIVGFAGFDISTETSNYILELIKKDLRKDKNGCPFNCTQ